MNIQVLSPQRESDTETGGITFDHPVDGLDWNGSQSDLRPHEEFIGSVTMFMINQIVYHHLHLFNRIEVNTIDESMKIGI
jgi:hypothetical protein